MIIMIFNVYCSGVSQFPIFPAWNTLLANVKKQLNIVRQTFLWPTEMFLLFTRAWLFIFYPFHI